MPITAHRSLRLFLFCLIILIPIGYWVYVSLIAPSPWFMRQDPEITYMMSSLTPFKGRSYTFVYHPGTPLEIVGSLLLALTYPFAQGQSFVMFHLQNPALFLALARGFMAIIHIVCIALLLRHAIPIKTHLDVFVAGAVTLSFYAMDMWAVTSTAYWTHNAFNFPFGTLILLGLLRMARRGQLTRPRNFWLIGFVAGVLTSIQLYFAAWVIGVAITVFAFQRLSGLRWRASVLAVLHVGMASLVGFLVATLPIIPYYGRFIDWLMMLIFNQGIYGTGAPGITSVESLSNNLRLVMERPLFVLVTGLLLGGLAVTAVYTLLKRRSLRANAGLWAVACGLSVQLVVVWLLILKHTAIIYLLSVAAIVPILLAVLLTLTDHPTLLARALRVVVIVFVTMSTALNIFLALTFYNVQAQKAASDFAEFGNPIGTLTQIENAARSENPKLSPCVGWLIGNYYSDHAFAEEVNVLCTPLPETTP
jgi:hypothetical protein